MVVVVETTYKADIVLLQARYECNILEHLFVPSFYNVSVWIFLSFPYNHLYISSSFYKIVLLLFFCGISIEN